MLIGTLPETSIATIFFGVVYGFTNNISCKNKSALCYSVRDIINSTYAESRPTVEEGSENFKITEKLVNSFKPSTPF